MLKHVRKRPSFWPWLIPITSLLGSAGTVGMVYGQAGWSAATQVATAFAVLIWIVVAIGMLAPHRWRK